MQDSWPTELEPPQRTHHVRQQILAAISPPSKRIARGGQIPIDFAEPTQPTRSRFPPLEAFRAELSARDDQQWADIRNPSQKLSFRVLGAEFDG